VIGPGGIEHPMVSVLMPTRDAENYVGDAIRSILRQSFTDFEFIIIDDGSADRTPEVVAGFADSRISFRRHESSKGISARRNELISRVSGKYFAWIDNDDESHPRRLELQVSLMEKNPSVGVCGTWMETFGADAGYIHKHESSHDELRCQVLFEPPVASPSCMFRTELLKRYPEPYDPSFVFAADYDLIARLIRATEFANIPLVLHRYRRHPGQTSEMRRAEIGKERREVQRACLDALGIDYAQNALALQDAISPWKFPPDAGFAEAAHDWFLRLLQANESRGPLNPTAFRRVLARRFFAMSSFFAPSGNGSLSRLRALPLHREADVGTRARFVQALRGILRAGIR